jgi:hypothetical protein
MFLDRLDNQIDELSNTLVWFRPRRRGLTNAGAIPASTWDADYRETDCVAGVVGLEVRRETGEE